MSIKYVVRNTFDHIPVHLLVNYCIIEGKFDQRFYLKSMKLSTAICHKYTGEEPYDIFNEKHTLSRYLGLK